MSKILVVDDLPFNLELLDDELSTLGFEVVTASDGEEALEQVLKEQPDLVLLDLSLPKKDGLEVLASLRADPQYRSLPVILLTARQEYEDRVKGLEAGADDYITKPFHLGEVTARVNALLRIQELQRQVLDRETYMSKVEGVQQTLVTLAHHINNATQAISGMAQICQTEPDDLSLHHQLVEISLNQSLKISAVIQCLQKMVDHLDIRTADYAGDPNRMLDIEGDLRELLDALEDDKEQ